MFVFDGDFYGNTRCIIILSIFIYVTFFKPFLEVGSVKKSNQFPPGGSQLFAILA